MKEDIGICFGQRYAVIEKPVPLFIEEQAGMRIHFAIPHQGQCLVPRCLGEVDGDSGFLGPQLPVVDDNPVWFATFVGVLKRDTVDRIGNRDSLGRGGNKRVGEQTHQQQKRQPDDMPGRRCYRVAGVADCDSTPVCSSSITFIPGMSCAVLILQE